MDGLGRRLRERARELGLADAEVARRAGLSPTRYGHYVSDYREPDLITLVRICGVLATTPDQVLAVGPDREDALSAGRRVVAGYAEALDGPTLEVAVAVMRALAVATVREAEVGPDAAENKQVGKRAPGRAARARKDA